MHRSAQRQARQSAATSVGPEDQELALGVGQRFLDRASLAGRAFVHVHPGDLYYSAEPAALYTLLGSCVAVCLWDPEARVGGITHYVLPDPLGKGEFSTRFGRVAVSVLVENLAALGAHLPRLQAKVFGGASVVSAIPAKGSAGEKNVRLARTVLAALGIPVVSVDTGGTVGRVVVFYTDSGIALVRKI